MKKSIIISLERLIVVLAMSFLLPGSIFAQSGIIGTCGTSIEDQMIIKQRMMENREAAQGIVTQRSGAIKYIPVRYHLYAKNDGTGRLTIKNVFDNLCAINKLYADQDIIFYIKEIKLSNNTNIYNDPSATTSAASLSSIANSTSNRNAVNIFVASKANAADLGVLAFYSPTGDYIVANMNYVNSKGGTLAHEIGHYFSLAHTFYGWECGDFDPINPPNNVCYNILTEYYDRTKLYPNGKLHCNIAADGFCDTQADYNLGFGWNGCQWSGTIDDPDGNILNPDEDNMMSYFLDCISKFSNEQKTAIHLDYNSPSRSFLRTSVYTPKGDISGVVNYLFPGDSVWSYDSVQFRWDAVPNATNYFVEVSELPSFTVNTISWITTRLDTVLRNLKPSKSYYWRVFPYNPNSICFTPVSKKFYNTSVKTASNDVYLSSWNATLRFDFKTRELVLISNETIDQVELKIYNPEGKISSRQIVSLEDGSVSLGSGNQAAGLYFYTLEARNRKTQAGKIFIP